MLFEYVSTQCLHGALPACIAGDNDHLQQLTKAVLELLQQEEFEVPRPQPADSSVTNS